MIEVLPEEKFWNKVVPECVASFAWGKSLAGLQGKSKLKKSLKDVVANLDEAEFDLFMAQIVIKGSGAGVVGTDLTAIVDWFKSLQK